MQLSFPFNLFAMPAGVVAERILKYHKEDKAACEAATVFLKKYQKLKAAEMVEAYKLCCEFLSGLNGRCHLEEMPNE